MIDRLHEIGYSFQQPAVINDSDVETLLGIENEAFPTDSYNRDQLLEEYKKDPMLFIVARDVNKVPVGYVSAYIRDTTGCIVSIAVERNLRGSGIGSCLNSLMVDYLKSIGARLIKAHVKETNQGSIRFFERFGFVVVDRVEDYYQVGSSALIHQLSFH